MAAEAEVQALTTPADIEKSPAGVVKRWLAELAVADRAEKDWRKQAKELWELYEGGRKKDHAFNIFWANTDTLAPALYNSTPQPDVRRRFRDADPLGKAVSQVTERALAYEVDAYDFDAELCATVLDFLVTGRGVVRVVYEPRFVGAAESPGEDIAAAEGELAPEAAPSPERVSERSVRCEAVQWDDFRRGPGKTWGEVPWIAFRHDFTQDMALEKFGPEIAARLKYSEGRDTDDLATDPAVKEIFKTAEVWEIWDKDTRQAHFIAPTLKDGPCLTAPDPLQLRDFFPMPRPAYAVPSNRTLVPIPLYRLYEEQAKELDRVSARINKITAAMKVRGAYSANMPELANLFSADDRAMIPVQNVSELASVGGLDKAIWMMPIERLREVLDGLYLARDQIKAAIYELTGISDIVRGATDAQETAAAQKLKSKWSTLRLQKMQREIQRTARDLFRLKAEVIAEQYPVETLAQITNLQFPTMQQQAQAQQVAMVAQAQGAQPPPEVVEALQSPTWEQIGVVMRSDKLREYRIDVETDSTVAETIDRDMEGLREVIGSVGEVLAGVAQGLPVEVGKEVALAVVRRARLGHAVEDALEQFQGSPLQGPAIEQQLAAAAEQAVETVQQTGAQAIEAGAQQIQAVVDQAGQQAALVAQDLQMRQTEHGQAIAALTATVQQLLGGLAQTAQAIAVNEQTTTAMMTTVQASLDSVAAAVAGVANALEQVAVGQQSVIQAVERPKQVEFTRGRDGRISGASATVQ